MVLRHQELTMTELATMPKYEAYKDSGVEWLGEVPEHWELIPGFVAFSENKRNNKGMKEKTVLSLSYGKIVIKPEEKLVGLVPESFETYQLVEPQDIIIRCTDLQNDKVSLRTGLATNKGIITSAYLNLKVKEGFSARYLHYYLHSLDTNKTLYKFGSGLRQNLSFLDFKRLPVFDISEEVQTSIANFLDKKTAQIDEAIAIKQQQIELLKERKQIIIQQAVTQGLDPDAPMKDSGVDWIGKIPEHWEVKKLKHVADQFMYGTSVDCNELEIGTPVLRIPNIEELEFNFSDLKYANLSSDETNKYRLKKNDILIIRTNGNPKLVGKSAIFNGDEEFMFASYLIRVRPLKNIEPYYLIRALNSFSMRGSLTHSARTSAGNYNLNTQALGNCYLSYPPIDEQILIMNYLKDFESKFKATLELQKQQIEKLKEYKITLINSAVTGKIKVPLDA